MLILANSSHSAQAPSDPPIRSFSLANGYAAFQKELRIADALAARQEKVDAVRDAGETIRYTKRTHKKRKPNGKWTRGKAGYAYDPQGRKLYSCASKDSRRQHDRAMVRHHGRCGPDIDAWQRDRNQSIFRSVLCGQSKSSVAEKHDLSRTQILRICNEELPRWLRKVVAGEADELHMGEAEEPTMERQEGGVRALDKSFSPKRKRSGNNPASSALVKKIKREKYWKAYWDRGGVHLPRKKTKNSEKPKTSSALIPEGYVYRPDTRDIPRPFLADPW